MDKKIVGFLIGWLVATNTFADDSTPETPERTVYGDWFTLCAKSIDVCTMNQVQYAERDGQRSQVLHVHISKNADNTFFMQMILPLGVLLPPGVAMRVDQGEEFKMPYQICIPKGCIVATQLTKGRMQALQKGNEALIGFRPIGTDKIALIKVSLQGFTKASEVVRNSTGIDAEG